MYKSNKMEATILSKIEADSSFYKNFTISFLDKYLSGSFGAMSKTEIDILVFHLLKPCLSGSNHAISRLLTITATRVKNLTMSAHLRYSIKTDEEIMREILKKLVPNHSENSRKPCNSKIDLAKDEVIFGLENPIEKDVFVSRVKDLGYYADFSFNPEVIKIHISTLFELLEDTGKFKDLIQKKFSDDKELQKRLNGAKTKWQKIKDILPDKRSTINFIIGAMEKILLG